jgi:hypothetical protein
MFERLYYSTTDEQEKKDILLAFKNESKFTKKFPIVNEENEEIAKIIKIDTYNTYLDFWLDNYLQGSELKNKNGQIVAVNLYDKENSKGVKQKRVRSVVA